MRNFSFAAVSLVAVFLRVADARASTTVFNLPYYVEPGHSAIGLEPELALTAGAAMGANLKYTYGLSNLLNLQAGIGYGDGERGFRWGGAAVLDIFPDIEKQPGIGLAGQIYTIQTRSSGAVMEAKIIPYIHKSFEIKGTVIDPFVAVPVGLNGSTQLSVGNQFKTSSRFRWQLEMGINISNAQTYFSGGLTYDPE
jgi:hypothetical protein